MLSLAHAKPSIDAKKSRKYCYLFVHVTQSIPYFYCDCVFCIQTKFFIRSTFQRNLSFIYFLNQCHQGRIEQNCEINKRYTKKHSNIASNFSGKCGRVVINHHFLHLDLCFKIQFDISFIRWVVTLSRRKPAKTSKSNMLMRI